jgi:predicted amidophosphoribosyltransferase
VSESAPREPDVCPRCGAHVEPIAGGHHGAEQEKQCPDCGARLRRRSGESWQLFE